MMNHIELVAKLNKLAFRIKAAQDGECGCTFEPSNPVGHWGYNDMPSPVIKIDTATIDALSGTSVEFVLQIDGKYAVRNLATSKYGFLDWSGRSPNCGKIILTPEELVEEFEWFLSTWTEETGVDLVAEASDPNKTALLQVGIGAYPIARVNIKTGQTEIMDARVVDGYSVSGEWHASDDTVRKEAGLGDMEEWSNKVLKAEMGIPEEFTYFSHGMNDTDEAGYVIFTNGKWILEDLEFDFEGYVVKGPETGMFETVWSYHDRDQ